MPEQLADVVEKDVAGIDDGLVQIHLAVTLRTPAMKYAAVEVGVSGAVHACRFAGMSFGIQHGRGHHDLENGTRSELRLNRAIQQAACA